MAVAQSQVIPGASVPATHWDGGIAAVLDFTGSAHDLYEAYRPNYLFVWRETDDPGARIDGYRNGDKHSVLAELAQSAIHKKTDGHRQDNHAWDGTDHIQWVGKETLSNSNNHHFSILGSRNVRRLGPLYYEQHNDEYKIAVDFFGEDQFGAETLFRREHKYRIPIGRDVCLSYSHCTTRYK